ncbi:hypothetical protein [Jiulongibacter sp. NS-SX5]|uniref:hypothetical protein n=1 Tax=Jiulongibacter sp. NS-SX5 TaxID=3463854 RepID=UPI00405A16E8
MTPILLGYAELVGKADKWTKGNRQPAGLIKNAAALLLFALLGGFGSNWVSRTDEFKWAIDIFNVLLFVAFLGKGSIDLGFEWIVDFFSKLTKHVGDAINRISQNFLPYLINLGIIAFIIGLIKFAITLIFISPVFADILRHLPFIDSETPTSVFKAFFTQLWLIPSILKYSGIVLDWTFFNKHE